MFYGWNSILVALDTANRSQSDHNGRSFLSHYTLRGYFCHRLRGYNTHKPLLMIGYERLNASAKSERLSQTVLCSIVQN